jgi:hypothetical protein
MSEQPHNLTDHDLLIRIDERTARIDRRLAEHLRHHWAVTLAAVGAVLSGLLALALRIA